MVMKLLSHLLTRRRNQCSGACRQLLRMGASIQLHLVCRSNMRFYHVLVTCLEHAVCGGFLGQAFFQAVRTDSVPARLVYWTALTTWGR